MPYVHVSTPLLKAEAVRKKVFFRHLARYQESLATPQQAILLKYQSQ